MNHINSLPKEYFLKLEMLTTFIWRSKTETGKREHSTKSVFIFDESTSALDIESEARILNQINELSSEVNMIMISHNLESLKNCNKVIRITNKNIKIISG